jgi:AcrR family transcriptional regulator
VGRIVDAAIAIADDGGLDAVSMKQIAARLEVGTMSLYTYVPDKSTLLELMLDAALDAPLPDPSQGWRPYLRQLADVTLDVYLRHPWSLQIFIGGPPIAPNQMRYLETTLAALDETGLDDRHKMDIAMSLAYFARGAAHIAVGIMQAERESGLDAGQIDALRGEAYGQVLDPEQFPHTLRVMTASGPTQRPDDVWDDFGFRFGLERFLDGIESYVATSIAGEPVDDPRRRSS